MFRPPVEDGDGRHAGAQELHRDNHPLQDQQQPQLPARSESGHSHGPRHEELSMEKQLQKNGK